MSLNYTEIFRKVWRALGTGTVHIRGGSVHEIMLDGSLWYPVEVLVNGIDDINEMCNWLEENRKPCVVHYHVVATFWFPDEASALGFKLRWLS